MSEDDDAAQIPPPRWWQFRKRRQAEHNRLLAEMLMAVSMVREKEDAFIWSDLNAAIRGQHDLREAILQDLNTLNTRLAAAEREVAILPVILTAWAETIGKHLAQIEALASHRGKTGGDA